MKKKLIMLLAMLALIACNSDEPDGSEYLQDMMDCQTDGIYEGIIVTMPCTDQDFLNANFGVWCELKNAPDDAHEKKAPAPRCKIYFLRSDFPNTTLETGDEVKFRILKLGSARNLPFVYFWDRLYYKCIVEPV